VKVAGALVLVGWLCLVTVLGVVPVSHGIVEAWGPISTCAAPVIAIANPVPEPMSGPTTGIADSVARTCSRRSGLRLAAASLVAGGGAAGALVLLRRAPRVRRGADVVRAAAGDVPALGGPVR